MNLWQRCSLSIFGRPSPEERMVFKIQIVLLLAICLLLNIGFDEVREWRRVAAQTQLHMRLSSWDGLAWYAWLVAAPAILLVIRKYPPVRDRFMRNLLFLAGWSLLICCVVVNARYLLRMLPNLWLPDENDLPTGWRDYFYNAYGLWPLDFLTYCGFFAVSFSLDYFFKHRRHTEETLQLQLQTTQLQSSLARAELAALRSQLHPHFLFNSFNALATLVRQRKNDTAVEIIAQLSALLRLAIDRTGLQQIPLHQEIDFIRRYLEIEQVRFGDKLRVEYAVDPAVQDALVPNIVLQPLVENAIKHGISLRTTPGTVRVAATRAGSRLQIEIANDAADAESPPSAGACAQAGGIGLKNTRAQLNRLYGSDYRLDMLTQAAGRTLVSLNLPFSVAPAPKMS